MANNQNHFISRDLYDHLSSIFKNQCPSLGTSPDKIWFDAGCAHVVSLLKEHVTEGPLAVVLEERLLSGKGESVQTGEQEQQQQDIEDTGQQTCFSYSL